MQAPDLSLNVDGALPGMDAGPQADYAAIAPQPLPEMGADEPTPPPLEFAPGSAPQRHVGYDVRGDVLWAMGKNYKASLSTEGFTFAPFLGSDAERNWPVTMRLESATYQGESLELTRAKAPERTGDRWSWIVGRCRRGTTSPSTGWSRFLRRRVRQRSPLA
ncbi:MAG: hypothetical protein R3F17_09830 [Planctomycetota bacterium]